MALSQDKGGTSPEALALVNGAIRKGMGLEKEDVALGLEFARSQLQRSPKDALRCYACLVLIDPSNIDCQVGLANCALQVEEYAIALQAASAVVAMAPRDPRGYYLSGRACFGLESYPEALEDLADAVKMARDAGHAEISHAAQKFAEMIALTRSSTSS